MSSQPVRINSIRRNRPASLGWAIPVLALAALLLATAPATAGGTGRWNTDGDGVAIHGYDPVAYHTQHAAVQGDPKYSADYDGAVFHFASAANRDAFVADPGRYAPKYGGYCAFAMGKMGKKVDADPKTFKLYDGDLLLFFNGENMGKRMNTIIPWNQDEQALHRRADANWAKTN